MNATHLNRNLTKIKYVGDLQGPSAEEQLASELQEAIAEARSHQKLAAQPTRTHRQTRPHLVRHKPHHTSNLTHARSLHVCPASRHYCRFIDLYSISPPEICCKLSSRASSCRCKNCNQWRLLEADCKYNRRLSRGGSAAAAAAAATMKFMV